MTGATQESSPKTDLCKCGVLARRPPFLRLPEYQRVLLRFGQALQFQIDIQIRPPQVRFPDEAHILDFAHFGVAKPRETLVIEKVFCRSHVDPHPPARDVLNSNATQAPSWFLVQMSDRPDISDGCARPPIASSVGAMSARRPPGRSLTPPGLVGAPVVRS